jgi:sugar/nucleoside kinase (ribokinase family)
MKNFDLAIYGNLILDQILYLERFPREGFASKIVDVCYSPGASANVARAYYKLTNKKPKVFSAVGLDLNGNKIIESIRGYSTPVVQRCPKETSTSVILANKPKSTRTGLVNWGACLETDVFPECKSNWKHFSYLDKVSKLEKEGLSLLSGIKSVDLTSFDYNDIERERIINCISEIDYVIAAAEESCFLTKANDVEDAATILGAACKGYAVIHEKNGSYISDGLTCEYVDAGHKILKDISVLGAGDIFVASFVSSFEDKLTIKEITLRSHQKTFELLREINEEKI